MQKIRSTFTVFFENPFWVGVYERLENGKLSVCKITFGSEPKDYEVYEFLLANWHNLVFSPAIKSKHLTERKTNPKRLQRDIRKQLSSKGIGTKAQLALKAQQEEGKLVRKQKTRQEIEAEKERQFQIRRQKAKKSIGVDRIIMSHRTPLRCPSTPSPLRSAEQIAQDGEYLP